MLKYIIFILVFNVLCFAEVQDFDIYEISDRKSVVKRQQEIEPLPEIQQPPHNIIPQRPANIDSVKKKDLNHKENSHSAPTKSQSTQTATKSENHEEIQKVIDSKVQNAPTTQEDKKAASGNETTKNNSTVPSVSNTKHSEHPGAALRGFYVFLGLSILIIIYFIFKAFRLRPGAPPPTTVRKYGIVGRRSDMEMLPLPLAEEEDDDTLFDMGTQINR